MISSLDQLPPVSTLIVQTGNAFGLEANFDLNYKMKATKTTTSSATQLRHFIFRFNESEIPWVTDLLSGQTNTDDWMVIGKTRETGGYCKISWRTVTVRRNLEQSQLVKSLILLAAQKPSEVKKPNEKCGIM